MIQFLLGLAAGLVVGLVMEWMIDWSSFSVRGRAPHSSPRSPGGNGQQNRSRQPDNADLVQPASEKNGE